MVDQFYGSTFVCIGFNLCLLCYQRLPVSDKGSQYLQQFCSIIFKISFQGRNKDLQRKPCRFNTWMGFVRQILILLKISSIWGFLQSFFEVMCRVINANTAVATQWPLKNAHQMIRAVWYCGPVAHCCSRYAGVIFVSLSRYDSIVVK